ncbi:MAG: gamma-glutamyl-gamma-aminobutyrate hydrolase family protein [Pseudomonadota bacterium]
MHRPTIGIISNRYQIENRYPVYAAGGHYVESVAEIMGATPIVIPSLPDAHELGHLMALCDGFILTGGRPNVHPRHWGEELTDAHGAMDEDRDGVALPLVTACVEQGLPIFGVCRGFQEMAVAYGSSLHPEIRDLPGRMNHRMPPDEQDLDIIFQPRHSVSVSAGGPFAEIFGATEVMVNSLHGQGVESAGQRVTIDGRAEDGTAEALFIKGAPGFALGVQWHAEYKAASDPVNRALFEAFGRAAEAHLAQKQRRAVTV